MASGKHLNIDLSFRSDTSAVQKDIQVLQSKLNDLLKSASKSTGQFSLNKELQEASQAAIELKQHIEKAVNVNTGQLDVGLLSKSFKQAGTSLEEYRQKLSKLGVEGNQVFSSLAKTILNSEVPLKRTNALLSEFATTIKNTARWQISSSILHGFMGSLQSALYYAKDLNESLNNIRIVTGYNTDQMAKFATEANKAAQALSTTTTEYTNASLIYYQQGLSDSEVKERTDVTIKMANVARESAETVSQQMTAVWNNFDDGSKSLEYYADVMTALGAATASSTDEIAQGLEKFAAVADTVGLSYEYATAALATVTATTRQSADVVGNAFKTLFARLQSLKFDETLDDGTDLTKYSQALENVGINIKNTSGELKDMDMILTELGERWTTLSKNQQVALATTVAGVRQYTQLIALMDNWDFFQQNLDVVEGSEGTLQKQAEIYAESWEAARDRVTAAAEEIYNKLLNDDFFIDLNNGFAELLDVISKAIDGVGGLQGVLSGLGILITQMYGETIATTLNNFFTTQNQRLKEWGTAQDQALSGLFEAKSSEGLYESGAAYESIRSATEALVEESKHLTEEQQEQAKLELKQLKVRAEAIEQYEKEVKLAEEALEAAEEKDTLTRKNAAKATRTKDSVITFAPGADTQEVQQAIANYEKVSKTIVAMGEEARNATPEFRALVDAMGGDTAAATSVATAIDNESNALREVSMAADATTIAETELKEANTNLAGSTRDLHAETEKYKKDLEDMKKPLPTLGEEIVSFAQGLMSISMAISTLKGLGNIWSDEETSYWEKLLSTITTLGMALPLIITGFKSLYTSVLQLPAVLTMTAASLGSTAAMEALATGGSLSLTAGLKAVAVAALTAQTALGPLWVVLAAVAAIAAVVITTGYALYKAYNADADAAKAAAAEAEALAEQYNAVKTAYDELKKSLEDYNSAKSALEDLTEGTQEWRDAVIELNNQVLELLDKYPQLAQYIRTTNDGVLEITQAGQEELIKSQERNVTEAYQSKLMSQMRQNTAQNKSDFTNLGRKSIYEENTYDGVAGTVYSTVDGSVVEKVVKAINDQGTAILKNSDALADATDISKNQAEALLENKDELIKLADVVKANTEANKIYAEQLGHSLLEESGNQNEKNVDQLANLVGRKAQELYANKYYDQYADKSWSGPDDKDVQQQYAKMMGYDWLENLSDNKGKYLVNGETKEIDDSVARAALAQAKAQDEAKESIEAYTKALQEVQDKSGGASGAVLDAVAGITRNVDDMTEAEAEIFSQFNVDLLSQETLDTLEISKEELLQRKEQAKKDWADAAADIQDDLVLQAQNIFEDLDLSDVTINGRKAIANVLDRAVVLGSEDTINMLQTVLADNNINGQKFADILGSINWDTITVDEFGDALSDAGIEISNTDIDLESLIDTMRVAEDATGDLQKSYAEVLKIISGLKTGDTISAEDYSKLGDSASKYFTMMMDGTYKLTGDAEEFYKLIQGQQIQKVQAQMADISAQNTQYGKIQKYDFDNLSQSQYKETGNGATYDTQAVEKQLEIIETLNAKTYEQREQLQRWKDELGTNISHQMLDDIADAVSACANQFENLDDAIASNNETLKVLDLSIAESYTNIRDLKEAYEEGTVSAEAFTKVAIELDKATDLEGLDTEQLKDYGSYLQEIADDAEDLSDELKENSEAAKIVAKSILKMNDGIDTLANNWENWSSILKESSESSEEYAGAIIGMKHAIGELLDISSEFVSSEFLTSHLEDIGKAAEGDAEAIDRLKAALADDIIANILLNNELSDSASNIMADYNWLVDNLKDIEIGATVDDGKFVSKMNELVTSANMTVDQVNALFDAMGFEANFATQPVLTTQRVPEYVTETVVEENTQTEDGKPLTKTRTHTYQDGYYEAEGYVDAIAMSTNGKTPVISGITKKATGSSNNYSSSNKGGSKGPGGKSVKGAKKGKDADKKDKIDDELDRYWDINNAISKVNQELERQEQITKKLNTYQGHYAGKTLIASLQKQNALLKEKNGILDKQYENYKKLYEIQSQELGELKGKIGGNWNGNELQNYAELFQANVDKYNAVIDTYNKMSAEQQEKSGKQMVEDAKKSYDAYKDALDRYQKLYYNEMYDTENKLAEYRQQQLENQFKIIENNLKAWETEIQLKLDMTGLKRDWKAFMKDVETDFRKIYKNLTKASGFDVDIFGTHIEDAETRIKQIEDVEAEIRKMEASKDANGAVQITDDMMFGSISEAQEKLKELQKELVDVGNSLNDMYKQVWDNYIDGLEQAKDNFEDINNEIEHLTKELEYEKELIELIYGDKAYELMDKYYTTQQKNIENQIGSIRQQAQFWEEQFEKAFEMNKDKHNVNKDDMSTWTEDMRKAYDNMIEAQEKLNDLVIEGIKNLKDEYLNNVAKTMSEMDKAMWGMDFDKVKEDWDFIQKRADEYLDDVEGAYKIQTLQNKINKSIAETTDLKAQQKLAKLREDEMKMLREKERLTQDDIDLAEARYQIALKEIALEDAQNSKTSMKLSRDTSGNWTYQYVADEEDTQSKQQELLDAYANLYETADNAYNHAMELAMQMYEEYQEKFRQISEDTTLSEEEKYQKLMELQDLYLPEIEAAFENSQIYQQETIYATAGVFAEVCEQDETAYNTLTDAQQALVDAVRDHHLEDYEEIRAAIVDGTYPELKQAAEDTFLETNENSHTAAAQVIDDWDKGGDSVKAALNDAFKAVIGYTKDFEKELELLEQISGKTITDPNGVVSDIEAIGNKMDEAANKTDEMADRATSDLDMLRDYVNEVESAWESMISRIEEAINALQEYLQATEEAIDAQRELAQAAAEARAAGADSPSISGGGSGESGGGGGSGGSGSGVAGEERNRSYQIVYVSEPHYRGSTDTFAISVRSSSGATREIDLGKNPDPNHNSQYKRYLEYPSVNWDTGGYTGDWGSSDDTIGSKAGKLAVLHQKELILNASDTQNMLEAVNIIRDIAGLNESINQTIANSIGKLIANAIAGGSASTSSENNANNTFNITAEFPNANDVQTIRDAILSLPNIASQYVHMN